MAASLAPIWAAAIVLCAAPICRGQDRASLQLGLALSLEQTGRCGEARPLFRQVLAHSPADPLARAGLARCAAAPVVRASVAVTLGGQAFAGGTRGYGVAPAAAIDLLLWDRASIGATYRYRFSMFPTAAVAPLRQHEAFLRLGYGTPTFGVSLHYALLSGDSPSHHGGLTARYSPFGDGLLQLSASFYQDLTVVRVQPSWRFPLGLGLSLQPGVAYQWTAAQSRYSAFLALSLSRRRFALSAGGRYGAELRPVDLDLSLVGNYTDPVIGGAWAGGALYLPTRRGTTSLRLGWSLDLLQGAAAPLVQAHVVHLGVGQAF